MNQEDVLCEMCRIRICYAGYTVGGTEAGWGPFWYWRLWAEKGGQEFESKGRPLSVALHRLMMQLPVFAEEEVWR